MKFNYSKLLLRAKYSISKIHLRIGKLLANLSVKGKRPMVNYLKLIIYPIGGSLTPNWVRLIVLTHRKIQWIWSTQGPNGVVKFLKTSSILIQQSIGGYIVPDITSLGRISRSKSGLPRWIPTHQRKLMMSGNVIVIKFYLTLLSLYRDIYFPGKLKLSTITGKSTALPNLPEISSLIPNFTSLVKLDLNDVDIKKLTIFTTAGPQSIGKVNEVNTSPFALIRSLRIYQDDNYGHLRDALAYFVSIFKNVSLRDFIEKAERVARYYPEVKPKGMFLGKLAIKEEAAGKVRVFAMVDAFTQWALKPLHELLFSRLRKIPMDGTFNQLKPLDRVPWGKAPIYSFDLSAATDRLPLSLQKDILSSYFSKEFAQYWADFLVGREYKAPVPPLGSEVKSSDIQPSYKYEVGQPMGALSSWAMLAITHHYIVQYCAWKSRVVPKGVLFTEYAVLGDDILIWNSRVAKAYLSTLKILGVECGLAKSVISLSGKSAEFAKRTIYLGKDCSPIPFKEMEASYHNIASIQMFRSKYDMSLIQTLRYLGYGYKVTQNRKNNLAVFILDIIELIPDNFEAVEPIFFPDRSGFNLNLDSNYPFYHSYDPYKGYGNIYIDTAYPIEVLRTNFVHFIEKSLTSLLYDLKDIKWSLIQLSTETYVKGIGPWGDKVYLLHSELITPICRAHCETLDREIALVRIHLESISDIISFYRDKPNSPTAKVRLTLDPLPNDLQKALKDIFRIRELADAIHVDPLKFSPPHKITLAPYLETKGKLAMLSRWSRIFNKVGHGLKGLHEALSHKND